MKILLTIHHELTPNAGAPGCTLKLGEHYQALGHNIQYYSFDDLPAKLPGIAKALVFPWFVAAHIAKLAKHRSIDVVDASTGDAWVWAKLRRKGKNSPLLVTRSHGLEHILHLQNLEEAKRGNLHLSWKYPLYHGGFRLWEVANSIRDADLVFLLNHQDLKYTLEQLNAQTESAHTVANGIPDTFLNLPFEPTPNSQDSTIHIAQIGSYIPRKGIQYGAPALNSILARYPQVKIRFLGTVCPEEQVYADFDPDVRDQISVFPCYAHEQLPNLLVGHQIKLFPTLSEGFSLALAEAMACGLAPVATATPGPLEILQDGHNGMLIPERNSRAIVDALERLICDRSYLEKLRRNAYSTAQHYSWETIATQTLNIYQQAKRC